MPKKSELNCYFGCDVDGPLHRLPKWVYPHEERFNLWKAVLHLVTQEKGNEYIYNNVRLCYRHFEDCYQLPSHRLTGNAIPTLNLTTYLRHQPEVQIKQREARKRECLDDTVSPCGAHKTPRLEHPSPQPWPQPSSFADAARADLVVAVTTCVTGHLSPLNADLVQKALLQRIIQQALESTASGVEGPAFRGKPIIVDGALKIWCENLSACRWLEDAVQEINNPTGEPLIVRRQIRRDLPRRVCCGLLVPGIWESPCVIARTLRFQNPWAQVDRWLHHNTVVNKGDTFLIVSVPEDVARELHARERRMVCGLGSVYVKFHDVKGKYGATLPETKSEPVDDAVASQATPLTGSLLAPATCFDSVVDVVAAPPSAPIPLPLTSNSGEVGADRTCEMELVRALEEGAADISDGTLFSTAN